LAETVRFMAALKCTLGVTLVESGEAALQAVNLLWAWSANINTQPYGMV
jgi:hypothetical protein